MPKTALLLDPAFERHDPGPGHPEQIERYRAITRQLDAAGIPENCVDVPLRRAQDAEILAAHSPEYFEAAREDIESGAHLLRTGDTHVCKASWEVALLAAGSANAAVDMLFEGSAKNAFCAARPPGHHATPDRGMGFCVFNNAAIAARRAQQKHGAERVAIIDWDVHHGNGTQDIFYQDGSVYYLSTHQSNWYPGTGAPDETGAGKGEATTLNAPLPAGSGFKEIGAVFREAFVPALDAFKPDLVIVSAGFDSRLGDPLGHFTLTDPQFVELTRILLDVADRHASGRLLSLLEGGYNIDGLAKATAAHLSELITA